MAKLLLAHDAINVDERSSGLSSLEYACIVEDEAMVELLLEKGAPISSWVLKVAEGKSKNILAMLKKANVRVL